jgi:hypothetical protein
MRKEFILQVFSYNLSMNVVRISHCIVYNDRMINELLIGKDLKRMPPEWKSEALSLESIGCD